MISNGIVNWNAWKIFLDQLQCDIYGKQVAFMTLSPNVMGGKVSSYIPVNLLCIISYLSTTATYIPLQATVNGSP